MIASSRFEGVRKGPESIYFASMTLSCMPEGYAAGLPAQVKCPMCGDKMSQMGIKDTTTDLTMSTLNYSVSDRIKKEGKKKHFVRTAVFVCGRCRNIQSFLLTESKVTGRKKNLSKS